MLTNIFSKPKVQEGVATNRKQVSQTRNIIKRLFKNPGTVIGLIIIVILIFVAIFADFLVDYQTDVIQPDVTKRLTPPNSENLLGTDELGRDILARLVYGARISLSVGLVSITFALFLGIILGSTAAYFGGAIDSIIMRICDVFEGIPSFLLAITITAAFGASLFNLMIAIGLGTFASQARIVRGSVLSVMNQEFVEAGEAFGARSWQIILFHILPNCTAIIIVQFTLRIAEGILSVSSMSFLGLGVQPPNPEWGAMLSGGRTWLIDSPYLTFFPGLCIMITILAFNMVGDGLRDALDPKLKH